MRAMRHAEETLEGTVKELNFAPKGEVDGLLLDVGGETIQVNLSPDQAAGVGSKVGRPVKLTVGPEPKVAEHPRGEHPVHKLVAFDGEAGHPHEPPHPPHGHKAHPPHGHGEPVEVSGTVRRLNFAKHGEANGVVLEGGDFLHLKPDGMKKVGLKVGQDVSARGEAKRSPEGVRAIEAEIVNGVEIGHKKPH